MERNQLHPLLGAHRPERRVVEAVAVHGVGAYRRSQSFERALPRAMESLQRICERMVAPGRLGLAWSLKLAGAVLDELQRGRAEIGAFRGQQRGLDALDDARLQQRQMLEDLHDGPAASSGLLRQQINGYGMDLFHKLRTGHFQGVDYIHGHSSPFLGDRLQAQALRRCSCSSSSLQASRSANANDLRGVLFAALRLYVELGQRPYRDAAAIYREISESVLADDDPLRAGIGKIDPHLAGAFLADEHPLGAFLLVADHDRASGALEFLHAPAHPSDHIRIVEVVVLIAVSAVIAGVQQRVDGHLLAFHRSLSADAVIISVENDRIAVLAEQDKRICALLEPVVHPRFQRFPRLGVMVVDERHRLQRAFLDDGAVEDRAQVEALTGLGRFLEPVMKGGVEQVDAALHRIQISEAVLRNAVPELADDVERTVLVLPDGMGEITDERMVDMLDRVQPEAVHARFLDQPFAPFDHFFPDLRVVVIDVGEHQVVVVAELVVDILVPVLVLAEDAVYAGLVPLGVEVGSIEMVEVPGEVRVLAAASGERESRPSLDVTGIGYLLLAVVAFDFDHLELLLLVRAGLMVHDEIRIDGDAFQLAGLNSFEQLRLRPVFRADSALLVEFAQIVQVVDAVAVVLRRGGFGGGRDPDGINAGCLKLGGPFLEPLPMAAVGGYMPFKKLHHRMVALHRAEITLLLVVSASLTFGGGRLIKAAEPRQKARLGRAGIISRKPG
ncbi:hypothetical protein BN871_BK_00260 [Paenibacillus sp. P22]|nr:hypothetical protein BN871_BK_00260 [Paenibacillus sp. P22]